MRNFLKLVVLIALVTVAGAASFVFFTDKEVVVLNNGTVKTVDQTWESSGSIFYEINDEIFLLDKNEIKSHGKRNLTHLFLDIKTTIVQNFNEIEKIAYRFLEKKKISVDRKITGPLVLMGILFFLLIPLLAKRFIKRNPKAAKKRKAAVLSQEAKDEFPTRIDIVRFFLNLFKLQIEADEDAAAEFVPLRAKTSSPNHIYELRVKHMADWVKRRMTIGPLGQESGSKSKCYYVIYDVHMVVKIPVRPIIDFEKYIESIKKEVHIVDKLAPKECIIPKVSVILGLIHKFAHSEDYSPERLEEKYIHWLRRYTEYQEYLKINNSFIFFMDLSKYFFLGHIIDGLHDIGNSIATEISENAQIIWEPAKFKGRYGIENDAIFKVREVYNRCEADIRRLISKYGITASIPIYLIQSWFFTHLAGKEITPEGRDFSGRFIFELNKLLKKSIQDNSKVVEIYRKTINDFLNNASFEQNKFQMESIISNLLDLLAWLREKRVSMRDLKPDNLFVAGDPSRYPLFLRSPNEFSLGIIDVETAVDFEKSKYKHTKQPLLGGTPFYATPSHFIKNEVIIYKFKNLGKILHLQDWHATLVMIYKVITGELLYEQTAKLFGDIKHMMINANKPDGYQSDLFEEASKMFWHSAVLEFQVKTSKSATALKSVAVILPETVKYMFTKVIAKERRSLAEAVNGSVIAQTIFEKAQIRDHLVKSSSTQICQLITELESKATNSKNSADPRTEAIIFLKKLAYLKAQSDRYSHVLKLLSQPKSKMTADDILTFMFDVVLNNMYSREWKPLFGDAVGACDLPDEEAIVEATTVC